MRKWSALASSIVLLLAPGWANAEEPPAPRVRASLLVDRMVARPGDLVRYAIVVRNVGDADAPHVRVEAHIPEGTTASDEECPETIDPEGDVCLKIAFPTPGAGQAAHQIQHSRSPLPAGEMFVLRYAVRVDDDAGIGDRLPNDAHVWVGADLHDDAPLVDTLVVSDAARGAFGSTGVDISGGLSTSGFDSSTAAVVPRAGHVGSNGGIVVSGGSVIDGDATPGPGFAVQISNNSRVLGSTAPAPAVLALNAVDAQGHAAHNDDDRICAAEGSCSGDVSLDGFDLVVSGTAILDPGSYFFCRLVVTGSLVSTAETTIWIGSAQRCPGGTEVRIEAEADVRPASGRPRDLQIRMQGAQTARVSSHARLAGIVYGPAGRFELAGGSTLVGAATVGAVAVGSGGATIHVDRQAVPN